MKRFVSIVMAIMMIASMFTSVSAATINEHASAPGFSYITNPLDMTLGVSVLARKNGEGEYSDRAISIDTVGDGMGIDYKATLDMSTIRGFFDKPFITTVLGGDGQAIDEFNRATVSSTINVAITYPADAIIADGSDLATAGRLEAGSIFSEVLPRSGFETAASGESKTLTITYKNADNLTAGGLSANKDTYLKDIAFYLDNVVSYNENGLHKVTVSLTGSTTINFESRTQTINYTGASSYIVSAAINHLLQVVPAVPATCDEKGWTEGVICVSHDSYNCGANGTVEPEQTIEILNHNTVFVARIAPTCTSTGVAEHWMCILCKKDFTTQAATTVIDKASLTLAKLPHDNETIPAIPATCTEKGLSEGHVCRVCGHTDNRSIIPANGHTVVTDAAVPATCETAGKTEGSRCSVCNTVLVAQKPIPALGHNWGEWTVTDSTEQTEGSKTRVCLNDSNHTETVTIPKKEHICVISAEDAVITKAATCTEAGEMQNYCACGEPVGEPVILPATGHSANVGHVAGVTATCTSTGILEHWSCETCGGLFKDAARTQKITSAVIDKDLTNHGNNKVKLRAIAPTCEEDGLTEGEKCVKCSTVTIPQTIVSKTGHTLEEIDEKPATCTHTGTLAHKHCIVCDKDFSHDKITEITLEQYTTPALGHSWDYENQQVIEGEEPTDEKEGKANVPCSNCGETKPVTLAKLVHTHNEECEKIVRPATCTADGLKRIVYTCCNEIKEDNIRIPAAHKPVKVNAIPADCFNHGTKTHWYCTVCEKSFEDPNCKNEVNLDTLKTDKKLHKWKDIGEETDGEVTYAVNECEHCKEVVKSKKNDNAEVKGHGGIKEKKDKTKEDRHNEEKNETKREVKVEAQINIDDREISAVLEQEIHKNDTQENKASENKVVLDIVIEKVTTYTDVGEGSLTEGQIVDEDREIVKETNDLIVIELTIPESMRGYVDFLVHRRHGNETHILTTAKNDDGEYIEIAADKSKVTLHVKKFSEYALVGYDTVVNPDPELPLPSPVTGGGTSSTVTVKFNANGGTVVNSVTVKRGEKITAPETTRDGYTFAGWYTDISLTKLFDFDTALTSNITLYAKWSDGSAGCPGTADGGCPAVHFADVDTSAWYHLDVDYVVDNGLMNGVAEGEFAPASTLTRAMLVTVLYRAAGAPEIADASQFADVAIGGYYEKAVVWAEQNGIVKGYSDTAFGPDDNILREQIAAIMHRYSQYKGYDVSVGENTNILSYTDVAEISEYAIPSMQYAVGSGLLKGKTESTLNPKDNTTRAEIAAILHRFFEAHK